MNKVSFNWIASIMSVRTKNRKGQGLQSVCAANELVILNTFFQHKGKHKYTWESRGQSLRCIIDYFVARDSVRASWGS